MNSSDTSGSQGLQVDRIQQFLATEYFGTGHRLIYTPTIDSTNTLAMRLAQEGSEEGVVVLTNSQTAGKGRQGRKWIDVAGNHALSSTILRPSFAPHFLVMIASLAVVDAIADTCSCVATIKWPNDILIEDRKVAGILIETRFDPEGKLIAIVGIGVNVKGTIPPLEALQAHSPPATSGLYYQAITLEEASGQVIEREAFIAHLLHHLENRYLALQQAFHTDHSGAPLVARLLRENWRAHLATLGRAVQVRQGNQLLSGVAEDVNEHGELLLRDHSGRHICITWGDVELLPRIDNH
ncbi:biotin--[acetyl-CoA-carboxylase] ligase [Tengunoibacter tsumagoiensis]|uniref:biotin--[biotin carboxyl-carrier protein] ligase n=1 Tax=Tengunoibacter tsumagoiensis TaxID=2014871 RepID=A0A402A293_9CHLR|nr:biotin--[acetyl-CoA-carboxylase] ligase [Tengunoibacter tsumagoiensis]GCE13244.1 hypothetical protein KTT_31030 [Tengunoibacter tsumagoiensis]